MPIPPTGKTLTVLALCLLTTGCDLPSINIAKQKQTAAGDAVKGFTDIPSFTGNTDKRYLATVRVTFSDSSSTTPLAFDVNRDRKRMFAARLWESEQTITSVNFGYAEDGPVADFKFCWRF